MEKLLPIWAKTGDNMNLTEPPPKNHERKISIMAKHEVLQMSEIFAAVFPAALLVEGTVLRAIEKLGRACYGCASHFSPPFATDPDISPDDFFVSIVFWISSYNFCAMLNILQILV